MTATETGTTAPAGTETPAPGTEQPAGDQPATGAPPEAGTTETADPRVTRANSEAARYRTERNTLQQQAEQATTERQAMLDNIAKALGLKADESADPAAQVTTLTSTVETLSTEAAQLRAELLVHTLAPEAGANPGALLDSRTFVNALHGLDPAADDYRTKVAEAIKVAVDANANLQATGGQVPPTRGGAPEAGQGAGDEAGAVTQDQFNAMSYGDRTALYQTNPALYARLSGR